MSKKSDHEKWLKALATLKAVPVIGEYLCATVSATNAHFIENPERGSKAARVVCADARSKRRGRGAPKMDPEQTKRAMVRRYVAEHGMDAALDHFTGADGSEQDYSYDTIIKYARGADKKYR